MITRLAYIFSWITIITGLSAMAFAVIPPLQEAILPPDRNTLAPTFFMDAARIVFGGLVLGVLCEISQRQNAASSARVKNEPGGRS